ncbi:titin-like [Culicoides brevitarsis]|uniref:titin-like n=1 Tax=Culicoides brevitarsis TaxID=469753 RepID=UPI00307B8529
MATSPRIPPELPNIMKDLTKEILRENPANIYEFAARYFESLIRKRDGHLNKNYERFSCPPPAITSKSLELRDDRKTRSSLRRGRSQEIRRSKMKVQTFEPSSSISTGKKKIDGRKLSGNDLATTSTSSKAKYNEARPTAQSIGSGKGPRKISEATTFDQLDEESGENDGRWLLNMAAIKIQRYVKRFLERKRMRDDSHQLKVSDSGFLDENAMKTAQKMVKNENSDVVQLPRNDSTAKDDSLLTVTSSSMHVLTAALTLQRVARGYLARKKYRKTLESKLTEKQAVVLQEDEKFEEVVEYNESFEFTEELQNAAVAIQKVYRGFHVRKELREKFSSAAEKIMTEKSDKSDDDKGNIATMNEAAEKIQALFKGHKVRKELAEKGNDDTEANLEGNEAKNVEKTQEIDEKDTKVKENDLKTDENSKNGDDKAENEKSLTSNDDIEQTETKTEEPEKTENAIETENGQNNEEKSKPEQLIEAKNDENDSKSEVLEDSSKEKDKNDDENLISDDVQLAAVTIQKNYKGYKTRKDLKGKENDETEDKTNEENENSDLPEQNIEAEAAAISIQKHYKGYKTRKDLNLLQNDEKEESVGEAKDNSDEKSLEKDENLNKNGDSEDLESTKEIKDGVVDEKINEKVEKSDEKVEKSDEKVQKTDEKDKIESEKIEKDVKTSTNDEKTKNSEQISPDETKDELQKPRNDAENTENRSNDTPEETPEPPTAPCTPQIENSEPTKEPETSTQPEEEEIDIDLNDPEVQAAAQKIQASFRGRSLRPKSKSATPKEDDEPPTDETKEKTEEKVEETPKEDQKPDESELEIAASKIQAGFRGHKTREELKQRKIEDKNPEEIGQNKTLSKGSTFDSENIDAQNAAVMIQKNFKGYKTRKELKNRKESSDTSSKSEPELVVQHAENQQVSFDFENPTKEQISAAMRIQRVYRKHRIEQQLRELKTQLRTVSVLDLSDPQVVQQMTSAAMSIQRFFRFHKKKKSSEANDDEKAPKTAEEKIHHQDSDTHVSETLIAALETDPHHSNKSTFDDSDEKVIELNVHQDAEKVNFSSTPRNDSIDEGVDEPEFEVKVVNVQETAVDDENSTKNDEKSDFEKENLLDSSSDIFLNQSDEQKDQNKTDEMKLKSTNVELVPSVNDEDEMSIDSLTTDSRIDHQNEPLQDSLDSIASKVSVTEVSDEKKSMKIDENQEEVDEPEFIQKKVEVKEPICVQKKMYKCPETQENEEKSKEEATILEKNDDSEVEKEVFEAKVDPNEQILEKSVDETDKSESKMQEKVQKDQLKVEEESVRDKNDESETLEVEKSQIDSTENENPDILKDENDKNEPLEEEKSEKSNKSTDLKVENIKTEASEVEKSTKIDSESQKSEKSEDSKNENIEKEVPEVKDSTKVEEDSAKNENFNSSEAQNMEKQNSEDKNSSKTEVKSAEGDKLTTQKIDSEPSTIDKNVKKDPENEETQPKTTEINEKELTEINFPEVPTDEPGKEPNEPKEIKPEAVENPIKTKEVTTLTQPSPKIDDSEVAKVLMDPAIIENDSTLETIDIKTENNEKTDEKPKDEEEIDIDLNDPEVQEAAKKIQASFKGRFANKKSSTKKTDDEENDPKATEIDEKQAETVTEVKNDETQQEKKPFNSKIPISTRGGKSKTMSQDSFSTENEKKSGKLKKSSSSADAKKGSGSQNLESQKNETNFEPETSLQDDYESLPRVKTPEIEDEVSEIVSFDTSTHDKSLLEEEYYSLKKKELQLDSRVSSTGSYSSGVNPKSTTTTNSSSSKEGSSSSTENDNVPNASFTTRRTTTMDSDEIVWGKIADSDSSAPSTATDRTVIHLPESLTPETETKEAEIQVLEEYKELARPTTSRGMLSKEFNKTFSTESDDVVVGTIVEEPEEERKLNETFVIHKSSDGSELNKTFIIEKRLDTGAKTSDSDVVVLGHINKNGDQLKKPPVEGEKKSFNDDEMLDELKALETTPRRRRLYTSMSVVQPPDDSDSFNPFHHASIYQQQYLDKIHGQSMSDTNDTAYGSDRDVEDEDQFDDFYPGNIRQKMMASSFSIADSDYFDPNKAVESIEDRIITALETITSTDSESTTASASTKVANNNARRILNEYSIGNAAITESLDEFVEQHGNISDDIEDESRDRIANLQNKLSRNTKGRFKRNALTEDHQMSLDEEAEYEATQVIQINVERKSSESPEKSSESSASEESRGAAFRNKKMSYYSLNVDKYDTAARRSLLQRENAFQKTSTPEEDLSAKSVSTGSNGKKKEQNLDEEDEKEKTDVEDVEEDETVDEVQTAINVKEGNDEKNEEKRKKIVIQPIPKFQGDNKKSSDSKPSSPESDDVRFPLLSIMRQRTLPVQIDTSIMRILPKHVVKRIKSANNPTNGSPKPKHGKK